MRHLLFLLLCAIVLLNAAPAPTDQECLEEIQKARACAKVAPNMLKLVPTTKFDEKEEKIVEFYNCMGPLKCELTKKAIAAEKGQIALLKLLGNLYDCLDSNDNYDKAKNSCRNWYNKESCSYDNFLNCIAEKLATKPECTTENVEEFKNLKKTFENVCEANAKYCKEFSGYGKVQL